MDTTMKTTMVLPQGSQFAVRVALGPVLAGRVISVINQQLSSNGIEWTVNRLKALRTAALQLRAGNHEIARDIYKENSIAYYHGTLIPRGPWSQVFTLYLKAQRPSVLRRIESVLRVYTALVLTDTSQKQALKAKTAITTPYQGNDIILSIWEMRLERYATETLRPRLEACGLYRHGTPLVRRPKLSRMKAFSATHKGDVELPRDLRATPYGRAALSFVTTTVWPKAFRTDPDAGSRGLYPAEIFSFIQSIVWGECTDNDYAGHITFLQERGAKARVVACPSAWLQWGFAPLHDWLDSALRQIPTSCVHDHNQGAYWLSRRIARGETLWCYDLSSATDRFPRSLQTTLLKSLGLPEYADALEEISNEDWIVSSGPFKGESWNYAVGQPMGLFSSFPVFTLTHNSILDELREELGISLTPAPYLILGDDVVISDQRLAEKYAATLMDLGMEVSAQKSVISSKVAEFAGFVCYRTNRQACVFRPYKHGIDKHLHNPLNLIHSLGSALGKTGSSYWKTKVMEFQLTKAWRNPDLSPLVPCQDESQGVNPDLIDTNRLSNLLSQSLAIAGISTNTYTGEEYELYSIEDLADILIDNEDDDVDNVRNWVGPYRPDQLLATPDPELARLRSAYKTQSEKIAADPLMREAHDELVSRRSQDQVDTTLPPVEECHDLPVSEHSTDRDLSPMERRLKQLASKG